MESNLMDIKANRKKQRGFARERISPCSTALIVIDMQKEFQTWRDHNGNPFFGKITEPIKKLITVAHQVKIPVIYTRQTNWPGSKPQTSSYIVDPALRVVRDPPRTHCMKGSWGWKIIDELPLRKGDFVIDKHRASAFIGTDLQLLLHHFNIRSLVITGVSTRGCVLYTTLHAVDYGYYVIVPSDCVAAPTEAHEEGMWLMKQYVEIYPSERLDTVWEGHQKCIR